MTMPRLKYVGTDRATDWIAGVPARDLTAAEAKQYPQAAASAFYVAETSGSEPSPAAPGEQEQE